MWESRRTNFQRRFNARRSALTPAIRSTFIEGKIYEDFSTARSRVSGTRVRYPTCTDTRMTRVINNSFPPALISAESLSALYSALLSYIVTRWHANFPNEKRTPSCLISYHWTRTKDWNGWRCHRTADPVLSWKVKNKREGHFSLFLYLELYHISLGVPSNFPLSISQRDFLI